MSSGKAIITDYRPVQGNREMETGTLYADKQINNVSTKEKKEKNKILKSDQAP